jgi:glycosyltransferase involved in cell wall biosynthesis
MMFAPEPLERYVPDGDVVFATAWALSDYVLGYSANKGKKCYLYQHYETWSGPRDKVDATWRAPFHKVVISKWLYEIGVALGATTMAYIPNGIDHDLFETYVPIRSRRRIVAMMFSQQAWKGSEDGLRALSIVKDRVPELRAILFGVRRPGFALPDWVEFHENPSQEDLVKRIYNASSCFLCPSHFEGFSLPAAEAMACGCAVVCTDCGGIRDFAEDGVSALISAPNDPEALAKNLFRVLQDDDLRVGLAEMGRRSIQQFTWERSTELMEAFLVGCINFTVV